MRLEARVTPGVWDDGAVHRSAALSPGMVAHLGRVRLRVAGGVGRILAGEGTTTVVDVGPPGAIIGRDAIADVRICGDGDRVSRRHALLQPIGRFWVLSDLGSTHGTTVSVEGEPVVDLPPDVPFPVLGGERVTLAGVMTLRAEIHGQPGDAPTTAHGRTLAQLPERLTNPDHQRLADALTKPRRQNPWSESFPTVDELADALHCSRRTVYNWLDQLSGLPAVARHLPDGRLSAPQRVGIAVSRAFPYLIGPRRTV